MTTPQKKNVLKKMPVAPVNIQKALKSNQKRLEAIEQRKKEKREAKKLNSLAKHIVFDSDGEDAVSEKGLMLFEGDSDEEDMEISSFNIKDRFEGKSGEKLFRLQQKIGTDKRFKLDDKFLDKDSTDEESGSEKNEEDADMVREREQTLKVIDGILGCTSRVKPTNHPQPLTSDLFIPRYDPERDLEETEEEEPQRDLEKKQIKDKKHKKLKTQTTVSEEVAPTAEPLPTVSEEKFYSISEDLENKFDGSTFKFSFTITDAPESPNAKPVEEESTETVDELPKKKPKLINPLNSLVDEEKLDDEEDEEGKHDVCDERPRKPFFYFPTNSELRNGLDDTSFHRTKGIDELMQGWPDKRTAVKNICRKARKEAIKKNRKNPLYY